MTNILHALRATTFSAVLHWSAFAVFTYIFGYASLYKILRVPGMMNGMAAMGFNEPWTIAIGVAEALGVLALLGGLFFPTLKNIAVLWLMPFSIGAFTAHMCYHHAFSDYRNSLLVCVLSVVILLTDKRFSLNL